MSLQLLLGSAGTGKSRRLLEWLIEQSQANPEKKYFLLVPEQFTMETQRDVVNAHPRHGTMNLDVVSFGRLAYRVFEELSVKKMTVLDDLGKSMLLRKAVRGHRKDFRVFGKNLDKAGFFEQLKSMLSELYQYGVGPKELSDLLDKIKDRPVLQRKLQDLVLSYEAFEKELKEDTIPSEELLDVLCRMVPKSRLLSESVIALDGFTGFTPIQYRLLSLLMIYAEKVVVTVTMDPAQGPYEDRPVEDLFYLSRKTIRKLEELAKENQVEKEKDLVLSQKVPVRFAKAPSLAKAEKHLLRYHRVAVKEKPEEICLYEAENPREESRFLAAEIYRLVREKGLRYRDIAVICGDLEQYRFFLEKALSDCQIPYFIDDKKRLSDHPAVALLQSAMEAVEKDFSYEPVFRFLKNPFSPLEKEKVDELENYALALGISGKKKWESVWEREYKNCGQLDFEKLNQWKEKGLSPLFRLQKTLKSKDHTVESFTKGLVDFLMDLSVEAGLSAMADRCKKEGLLEEAGEHEQAYGLILDLFDQIVGLMGQESLSFSEYKEILETGFQEIKVGLIPSTMDRLLVGDMERTRLNQIKVLFFAGVNDGNVPKTGARGGLFSDQDRELLEKFQIELAPTAKKNCFIQRFYLYLTVTKPSSYLAVSYCTGDMEGNQKLPSSFIRELRELFPALPLCKYQPWEEVTTKKGSAGMLLDGIREFRDGKEPHAQWKALYNWYYERNRKELTPYLEAAFGTYSGEKIHSLVTKALYGEFFSGSVSRLETYAACAYAQFLQYGLGLCEREEYSFQGADLGTVFHQSISLFFERMKEEGLSWGTLSEEKRKEMTESCVDAVAEQYGNTILKSSARNRYQKERILRIVDRTIWALVKQIQKGSFRPYETELSFSAKDADSLRLSLSQDQAMYLNGRIDRVDICETDEKLYVKIVDYKSGNTKPEPLEIYYGLQLQLSFYLDAAVELLKRKYPDKEVVPGGMEYFQIQDPVVDWEAGRDEKWLQEKILEALSPKGFVNSAPEALDLYSKEAARKRKEDPSIPAGKLLEKGERAVTPRQLFSLMAFVKDKVKELGRELSEGQIPVNPYSCKNRTACDYCAFRSVCGFDPGTPGFSYRRLSEKAGEKIFEEGKEKSGGEEVD